MEANSEPEDLPKRETLYVCTFGWDRSSRAAQAASDAGLFASSAGARTLLQMRDQDLLRKLEGKKVGGNTNSIGQR